MQTSRSDVVVLGCGPAGLLAAHAIEAAGHSVAIISKKQKSRLGGAQYLHHSIPGLTSDDADGYLAVVGIGNADDYSKKIYGEVREDVSWSKFVTHLYADPLEGMPERVQSLFPIWDMVSMYDLLWERWKDRIINLELFEPDKLFNIGLPGSDYIVSTIPAPVLCQNQQHFFKSQSIYVTPDYMWRPITSTEVMVYNSAADPLWCRTSSLFGRHTTEYPIDTPIEYLHGGFIVDKPLETNCDCKPHVLKVGRYGKWHKGDLVTDVYDEVFDVFSK